MIRLDSLRRDMTAVNTGEWIDNIPGLPDISLFVKGDRNDQWLWLQSRVGQRRARELAAMNVPAGMTFPMPAYMIDGILTECLIDALKDWRGFDEPYDAEKARKLITEPAYQLFRDGVMWAATKVGFCRPDPTVALAKIEAVEIKPLHDQASLHADAVR